MLEEGGGLGEHPGGLLREIAALEADCHAHAAPRLERTDVGFVFVAEGDEAFLFAQFFLALESGKSALPA
jgi:hypothetical protein